MSRLAYVGFAIAAIFIVAAIFAPWIATHDYAAQDLGLRYASPSAEHWFGTDGLGRDVFSRVVYGARISLEVGISVVVVSALFGTLIGAVAGFYGGFVDKLLSGYVFNVFLAFPGLLLAIALVAFLGAGQGKLIAALCIIGWVGYARMIRAQVLKVREYDYVQAARALGVSNRVIMFRHLLPNAMVATMTFLPFIVSSSVMTLTALDFLGFGLPPGSPSLGELLAQGKANVQAPWLGFTGFFAVAIMLSLLIFIGEGVRDAFDPRKTFR